MKKLLQKNPKYINAKKADIPYNEWQISSNIKAVINTTKIGGKLWFFKKLCMWNASLLKLYTPSTQVKLKEFVSDYIFYF